jgi:multiple sugar transport system ATP-binding protein
MIAGLEPITDGTVRIGGEVVNDRPPKARDIAMIFQNYALYPHMSAYENIAFGLKLRKVPRRTIRDRVKSAASVLGLAEVLPKKPRTLSGGQRQRVAMGRAIVREPRAFLMDEPLSNLDAKLRVQMRAEIARLQRELGVTTIYVTHDQSEAMTLGDRVAVLRQGLLQQVDAPPRLYAHPVNLFVAEFIGSPAMNLVQGRLERANGELAAVVGDERLRLDERTLASRPALRRYEGREVVVGIRPEDFEDAALARDGAVRFPAQIDLREDMGSEIFLHFAVDAPPPRGDEVKEILEDETAAKAMAEQARRRGTPFVARVDRESRAREGERVELAVATNRLHFFDPMTGDAIYDEASSDSSA